MMGGIELRVSVIDSGYEHSPVSKAFIDRR